MRKIIMSILVCAFVFTGIISFSACGDPIVGTWKASNVHFHDYTSELSKSFNSLGEAAASEFPLVSKYFEGEIVFKSDNTGTISLKNVVDEPRAFTWQKDDNWFSTTINEVEYRFYLSGTTLSFSTSAPYQNTGTLYVTYKKS